MNTKPWVWKIAAKVGIRTGNYSSSTKKRCCLNHLIGSPQQVEVGSVFNCSRTITLCTGLGYSTDTAELTPFWAADWSKIPLGFTTDFRTFGHVSLSSAFKIHFNIILLPPLHMAPQVADSFRGFKLKLRIVIATCVLCAPTYSPFRPISTFWLVTDWTGQGPNSDRSEIFRTRQDQPCGPPNLL